MLCMREDKVCSKHPSVPQKSLFMGFQLTYGDVTSTGSSGQGWSQHQQTWILDSKKSIWWVSQLNFLYKK